MKRSYVKRLCVEIKESQKKIGGEIMATKVKFREDLFQEIERIVLMVQNRHLSLDFYQCTGRKEKAEEIKKEIYESLLAKGEFAGALRFAKEEMGEGYVTNAAKALYEKEMKGERSYDALKTAKEHNLGKEKITQAAKAYYDLVLASAGHDPQPAIQLAQEELGNDHEFVKKAVLSAFDKYLGWGYKTYLSDLKSLVLRFSDLIDPARKELISLFS